jgi:hypothetical protein
MPRGLAADAGRDLALTPRVVFTNLFPSFEVIVSHHHQTIRHVELVGVATAVAIDFVPVSRLQAIEGVPELDLVMGVHFAPLVFEERSSR